MRRASIVALTVVSVCSTALTPARVAAQDKGGSPYKTDAALELSLSGAAIVTTALLPMLFVPDALDAPACGACDISTINAFDRPVTGYYNKTARTISDIAVGTLIVSPFVFTAIDTLALDGGGLSAFASDATVLTETFAAQLALMQIVKHIAQRPRPFTYNPDADADKKLDFDSTLSFYSGHSSSAFSMAIAYAITYQERHPDDPKRFLVWGGELSLAALTATMRVSAGKHFWSDVITGALVGTAFGVLIPTLHLDEKRQSQDPVGASKAMPIMFRGVF